MKFVRYTALSAIDASVASSPSIAIEASQLYACSVQVIATGAPVGAVKLQAANDPTPTSSSTLNWVDIASATVAVTAAGVFLIPKTDLCYDWIRVVYTKTSGTGAITANLSAQAL